MSSTHIQAIHSALSENWDEAVKLNLEILSKSPEDIEALNRLGFAYLRCGNIKKAREAYEKVISLDHYNAIALKNLQKAKVQGGSKTIRGSSKSSGTKVVSPAFFLEEPGKTKIVTLVNVAPSRILFSLSIGESVSLVSKKHTVELRGRKGVYLGALPDDLGFRLRRLILSGNRYIAYVKSVGKNSLTIFIKEVKRGRRFKNQPTFPINGDLPIYSFVHPGLVDEQSLHEELTSLSESVEE